MAAKQKFYVVWVGAKPGIYRTWDECKRQVAGFPNAKYKSFKTWGEANAAFKKAPPVYRAGSGKGTPPKKPTAPASKFQGPALSVDAACSGNPGRMEYRAVEVHTGEEIFHAGPFPVGTNNIGEFLGIVDGLRYLIEKGEAMPLFTDSAIAMGWVEKGKMKTTLERNATTEELFQRIDDAEKWLATHTYNIEIRKWPTKSWGEIPADFGRK